MLPAYKLKLMFEWGGGCLWGANDETSRRFGVGPLEDALPISEATRRRLEELTVWHDESLNWDYPPDPGPWSLDEYERFDLAARRILEKIRSDLGAEFDVDYKVLGSFENTSPSL